MPRRKRKGSSRKCPLVFTESPVETSRHIPSPVFAARNPITADLVAVHEKQQLWVSPQIDPNAPHTPARRCRARRNKTACALDPLTQTQRGKEVVRRQTADRFTSLRFLKDQANNARNGLTVTRGIESTDSSSETATESSLTDVDETLTSVGVQKQTKSAEKTRSLLREIGIAGRTRAQRRRSQSECSLNCSTSENLQKNLNLAGAENDHNRCTRFPVCGKENIGKGDLNKLSTNQVTADDQNTTQKNLITERRKSYRILQKHIATATLHKEDQSCPDSHRSTRNGRNNRSQRHQSGTLSSDSKTQSSRSRVAQLRKSSATSDETNTGRKTSQHRPSRAKKASTKADILAYDTPEAEYGIRVSLRRRRKLLPTPARNKLMLDL